MQRHSTARKGEEGSDKQSNQRNNLHDHPHPFPIHQLDLKIKHKVPSYHHHE